KCKVKRHPVNQVVSFYKFVRLEGLEVLRSELKELALKCQLKGTILLAKEGINAYLAGAPAAISEFFTELRSDARFADITCKDSYYEGEPFRRMLVKIKREIITMNQPDIDPLQDTGAHLPPLELKRWLDEGRD